MPRFSYSELKERRAQRDNALREERRRNKKELKPIGDRIRAKLMRCVKDCGLTKKQISQATGLEYSTVDKFLRGYNKSVNIHMLAALATVAGYEIKIEPIDPKRDKYRQERRLPPPPV